MRYLLLALYFVVSPFIFLVFLFGFAQGSLGSDPIEIFGIQAFEKMSTNVYAIHLGLYVGISIFIGVTLTAINFYALTFVNKKITMSDYLERRVRWPLLIPGAIGAVNLLVWVGGMEGNIFGFIFGLPLLFGAVFQGVLFIKGNLKLSKEDRRG